MNYHYHNYFYYNVLLLVLAYIRIVCFVDAYDVILRIGTRPSTLAMAQAQAVAQAWTLQNGGEGGKESTIQCSIIGISAKGHVPKGSSTAFLQDVPLAMRNDVDFTGALDQALIMDHEIDVAVHSAKDLPPSHRWWSNEKQHFQITCPLPRQDPSDVLIGPFSSLHDMMDYPDEEENGGKTIRIGTSSIRRQAQLWAMWKNQNNHSNNKNKNKIQVINIRGNIEERLAALQNGTVDALILAKSGLNRLHLFSDNNDHEDDDDHPPDPQDSPKDIMKMTGIPLDVMLPGLCQGIVVAVVTR